MYMLLVKTTLCHNQLACLYSVWHFFVFAFCRINVFFFCFFLQEYSSCNFFDWFDETSSRNYCSKKCVKNGMLTMQGVVSRGQIFSTLFIDHGFMEQNLIDATNILILYSDYVRQRRRSTSSPYLVIFLLKTLLDKFKRPVSATVYCVVL